MGENHPANPPPEDLVFRRGKLRRRDDPATDMFRDALANVTDTARVKRILFELGRLYNPVTNGPILDGRARRQMVEWLEAGRTGEVLGLLEEHFKRYTGRAIPPKTPP
jgi:hypothetical protein